MEGGINPGDLVLPTEIVHEICKSVLPAHANIEKSTQLKITDAAAIFISFITRSCIWKNLFEYPGQPITAEVVLETLKDNQMEELVPKLMESLKTYRANSVHKDSTSSSEEVVNTPSEKDGSSSSSGLNVLQTMNAEYVDLEDSSSEEIVVDCGSDNQTESSDSPVKQQQTCPVIYEPSSSFSDKELEF